MDEWNENEFQINREKFVLKNIKISNYFNNDGDYNVGQIISSSIEINNNEMIITINYIDKELNNSTDISEKEIDSDIINKISEIDLRTINNNYLFDDNGSYWTIEYNNLFKICGDFINTIDEYNKIISIIDYKNIINNRIKEIYGD